MKSTSLCKYDLKIRPSTSTAMEFYFWNIVLALNHVISAGEEHSLSSWKTDAFGEFLCWVAAFSVGRRWRRELPPLSLFDGCVLGSRNMRGVRNDGVMPKALTNELLKVLLQPFKMLQSRCSALPSTRATSPSQSTRNRGRAPTQALELTGLRQLSRRRRWDEYKVEGGACRHMFGPTDLVHRQ